MSSREPVFPFHIASNYNGRNTKFDSTGILSFGHNTKLSQLGLRVNDRSSVLVTTRVGVFILKQGQSKKTQSDKTTRIQVQNRERILNAGLYVFSRFGYRGSTVAQIAERAEMSKANMLYYYKSKNEIYVSVLEQTLTDWLAPLVELDPNGDPASQIWAYTKSKLALSKSAPDASRLFANEVLQGAPMIKTFLQTDLKRLVDDKCAVIQYWIDDGKLAQVTPLNLLLLIWAATQHYADFSAQTELLCDDPDTLFADAEATLKTIVLNGLIPR